MTWDSQWGFTVWVVRVPLSDPQEILRTHRWTGSQFSSPPDRSALLADLARRLRSLDQERMAREEDSRAPLAGVARPSMAPSALHLQAPMELDPLPQLQPLGEDAGATAGHPRAVQDDPATNSVAEYKEDIIQKNFREEGGGMPQANYMDRLSPDINGRMRAILIDWLIEVHTKYNLRSETLFLTRNLIDRYLSRMPTTRRRLQLVGVVSMFVAAKFEEVDPPTARSPSAKKRASARRLRRRMFGRGDDTVGNPYRAQISQFELFELV